MELVLGQSTSRATPCAEIEELRLLDKHEVRSAVKLSMATIYSKMARDEFPPGVLLSPRCRRWPARDIAAWLKSRVAQ